MGFLDSLLSGIGIGGAVGGLKEEDKRPRFSGRDIAQSAGRSMAYRPELLERREMMQPMQRRPRYEDKAFVGNPGNLNQYSPMNADVRNFQGIDPDFALRMQGGLRGIQPQVNPMGYTPGYNQDPYSFMNTRDDFNGRLRVR